MTTVRPGQIWQDNDKRSSPGRKVRVVETVSRYAFVEPVGGGTVRRIAIATNRDGAHIRGYRLVSEPEED